TSRRFAEVRRRWRGNRQGLDQESQPWRTGGLTRRIVLQRLIVALKPRSVDAVSLAVPFRLEAECPWIGPEFRDRANYLVRARGSPVQSPDPEAGQRQNGE